MITIPFALSHPFVLSPSKHALRRAQGERKGKDVLGKDDSEFRLCKVA